MAEVLRQDWDQDRVWQASPGMWLDVQSMTREQVTQAMTDIALMPRLSTIATTVLWQALKARGQALMDGNA